MTKARSSSKSNATALKSIPGAAGKSNPPATQVTSTAAVASATSAVVAEGERDSTANANIVTGPGVGREKTHAEFVAEGGGRAVEIQEAGSQVFSAIDFGSQPEPSPVVLNLDVAVVDVLVDVLIVTGPANGARRAGLRFGPAPTVLPLLILRQDEIESIENDKRLSAKREQRAASDI